MNYLVSLLNRTTKTFLAVSKIMIPVMVLVRFADLLGLTQVLGHVLEPLMGLLGLPGEVGIVWAIALIIGLYGGMGALIAMAPTVDLSVWQFNILVSMILFAHAIPLEQTVIRKAGGSFWWTTAARLFCAVAFAVLIRLFVSLSGWGSEPATMGVISVPQGGVQPWMAWSVSTVKTFVIMWLILFALLAMIDGMKKCGFFEWVTEKMTPFFLRLGILPSLAPLTTIGMLLGLTYGSGLILDETERNSFSPRELMAPLVGLSILHAIIEDTVIMLAFGADFWVSILARTLFALGFLCLIAKVLEKRSIKAVAERP